MGIDPGYFWDEISPDEVVAIMKARNENYSVISREAWEQTRLQCFYSATAFGGKIKKPTELFKFPWESNKKVITKEDALARLGIHGKQQEHISRG